MNVLVTKDKKHCVFMTVFYAGERKLFDLVRFFYFLPDYLSCFWMQMAYFVCLLKVSRR